MKAKKYLGLAQQQAEKQGDQITAEKVKLLL